ncbi:NAD(P)-binding domain-containing protein [Gimesia chilikensis]|uniref:Ferredoxin--NADP reductase n=1 Tax=Gimesia chilikensis TaxID=2605989 RepID=A0A517PT10_9PLAN|nr:NAD(P)-binding domain-containing protein [Gimesia chilikensis]QDT22512.1 Ferredoxin--NADP reductase [Gimesia chilikensis]
MTDTETQPEVKTRLKRLAIIGGGSSGLISLKNALESLNEWEIICYEKSDRIIGCWGNPYPGFVSTSTKYTTQFSCFAPFNANVNPDGGTSRSEFFRNDEYGQYLEQFAEKFSLQGNILTQHRVDRISRNVDRDGWELLITDLREEQSESSTEYFDCVILCTGLTAQPVQIDCQIKMLPLSELNHLDGLGHITEQRIVVIGGGESAVDYANRLAQPELNNKVFLSLRSGIRVSPRYHPIRGVPSDFLRNRLMLSIHENIRNWIGQRFVELRIRYQETFRSLFPAKIVDDSSPSEIDQNAREIRKEWAFKLTKAAKDDLFNMFHNKSDDFLDAVGAGRITIVGPPDDNQFNVFRSFDSDQEERIEPTLVVPAVGFQERLSELSEGHIQLSDFYLGCVHATYPDLFLVGFARPIIGNIPSISEVQARYICGLIAETFPRPADIEALHRADAISRKVRFKHLRLESIYPVEMFPYCDQLARLMNTFPTMTSIGSLSVWYRMQLTPATTLHYDYRDKPAFEEFGSTPVYMPKSLILILLLLKPFDLVYRAFRRLFQRRP